MIPEFQENFHIYVFSPLHHAYCLIHVYFTNICTCDSHNISVNTLIVKMDKTLNYWHSNMFRFFINHPQRAIRAY